MEYLARLLAALSAALLLAGCAAFPPDLQAELPYCHKDRGIKKVCTKENVPSLEQDVEAKQFRPVPDALTLYVVRYWGDGHHPLTVQVDGGAAMETVPESMIRVRLKPGTHTVSFDVDGKTYEKPIKGSHGEVRLLGITGTDWSWGSSSHAWSDDSDVAVKKRASRVRLISDISLP